MARPLQSPIDGPLLADVQARAQALWPGVALPAGVFARHVADRGIGPAELIAHGVDVYFACACGQLDPQALRAFDRKVLPALTPHLARLGISGVRLDEVQQQLRVSVLAGPKPGIGRYAGRGPLLAWLRTVAARIAFAVHRLDALEERRLGQQSLVRLVAEGNDPELTAMKHRVENDFQRALGESLASLSARSKAVLRLHYVDGLNIETIGAMYDVHRATVARWLVAIRTTVLASLRERLALPLRPSTSDFRSLVAAVRDELHISMDRLFEDVQPDPE